MFIVVEDDEGYLFVVFVVVVWLGLVFWDVECVYVGNLFVVLLCMVDDCCDFVI